MSPKLSCTTPGVCSSTWLSGWFAPPGSASIVERSTWYSRAPNRARMPCRAASARRACTTTSGKVASGSVSDTAAAEPVPVPVCAPAAKAARRMGLAREGRQGASHGRTL